MNIQIEPTSHFSIHNLPYGIFSTPSKHKRAGIAIGNQIKLCQMSLIMIH